MPITACMPWIRHPTRLEPPPILTACAQRRPPRLPTPSLGPPHPPFLTLPADLGLMEILDTPVNERDTHDGDKV